MVRLLDGQAVRAVVEDLARVAAANPAAVALVAVALVVALAAAYLLFRRLPPGVRLARALAAADSVAVLMHPNPDPDAMASALGVARIAEHVETPAVIHYPGEIRHQENRAFRTVLDLDFRAVDAASDLASDVVVLVDHDEARGFTNAATVTPYAVVDHHPGEGEGEQFTDVRADYGACASIVTEYFEELGSDPERSAGPELSADLATGLLYGVLSDTNRLTRGCSPAEFEASAFLYPAVDEDALDRIANPQVDAEVLEVKARAINRRDVRNPFAVSDVGEVSNVDAIPQAADELLGLEGVSAVVVVGEKEGTIYLSGRSRDDRVHMGDALDAAVEGIPLSSAGGHARMGGGQIAVDDREGGEPAVGVAREELTERLFESMVGER